MFKKRSKSPSPSKSRSPDVTGGPPVPTPSKSFTFRKSKDSSQRDKKSVTPSMDFSPRADSSSSSSYDASSREKPLPEPSSYQILQESAEETNGVTEGTDGKISKLYRMGTDALLKANDTYVTETGYVKTVQKFGTNVMDAITKADNGLITSAKQAISSAMSNSAVIENAMHIADNLADIGKVLPFVSPAFVLLKIIIDIEKKARDAEAKCTDLLERINFMMGNLTVLEKVSVTEAVKGVVLRIEKTLKTSLDLISAYRKQGVISRRLNFGNKDKFESCATKVKDVTGDLMISLQIQQTGQLDILSRGIPMDTDDQLAQEFVNVHGEEGKKNPELVQMFAQQIHCTMDADTMQQLTVDITDIIKENQEEVRKRIQEQVADAVAKGFEDFSLHMLEIEKEDKLLCVQCDEEYRESLNGKTSCAFHNAGYDDWNKSWPCCGQGHPCARGPHRQKHHSEYPYNNFFKYARDIINYVDTVDEWAECKDADLETGAKEYAMIGHLLRWTTNGYMIGKPTILIHIGTVWYDQPYYFQTFTSEDIQKVNMDPRSLSEKCLIYRTTPNEAQFTLAEWTFDKEGVVNGIQLTAKAASSDEYAIKVVPISSATAELAGDVQVISKGGFKIYTPNAPYILPEMQRIGPTLPSQPSRPVRDDFVSSGSARVALLQGDPLVPNAQYAREDMDYFHGSISVFNKSKDTPIVITGITAQYRMIGDHDYLKVEALDMDGSQFPLKVEPFDHKPVIFRASVPRTESDAKLGIKMWNRALVARDRPIRIKFVAQEIDGDKASLVMEYVFNPYPPSKPTSADFGFFFVDDIPRCDRYVVRVKAGSDTNVVDIGSKSYGELDLHRLVHRAISNGRSEVDLSLNRDEDSGLWRWNAWALIDISCRRVYAFKVLITDGFSVCLGYAPCPEYGDATETRDIQYADEKAYLPEVTLDELPEYAQSDDIDDVIEHVEIPNGKQASNGNGASNGIATEQTPPNGNLELRLESIDRNLDRLATAMENLVTLLAQRQ
ncbi:hypothetical protein K450DRAFT_226363 [Umbelopsis ramanniana AG]|uniref:Uncharacterized protein n=1 Tax=Umbelopsis ramanniana AG TaxID=1314678 RepID=A0AAD5EFS5_UMBRA|nr:uncharacterized protein K450DRAFT_226363 [Umbelopsis ramanniana AG]KAI8582669.1 hypothetical protein K450DRAFT_226363 [Umbelopsis ramanniana AG]